MIARLIGLFVIIIVGLTLIPTISNQVSIIFQNTTITNSVGASSTILSMIPVLFGIGLIGFGIILIWSWFRNNDNFESKYSEEDDYNQREQMGSIRHERLGLSARKSSEGCRLPAETNSHMPVEFKSEQKHGEQYFNKSKYD